MGFTALSDIEITPQVAHTYAAYLHFEVRRGAITSALREVRHQLLAQSAAQAAGSAYSAEQLVEKIWIAVYDPDEGVLKPGDPSRLISQS